MTPIQFVFDIFLIIFCVTCIIAVIALSVYVEYRRGNIIGLLFLSFIGCGMALFAYIGYQYGGEDVARLAVFIGGFLSYIVLYVTVYVLDYIFCPFPSRKKCTLQTCHPHYYNWIPIQEDIWYRECYICHQEYVLFCFKYETTVSADGTLKPYMKRTKWGWRKDEGLNSEIPGSVTPEVIDQTREKWKKLQKEAISSEIKSPNFDLKCGRVAEHENFPKPGPSPIPPSATIAQTMTYFALLFLFSLLFVVCVIFFGFV